MQRNSKPQFNNMKILLQISALVLFSFLPWHICNATESTAQVSGDDSLAGFVPTDTPARPKQPLHNPKLAKGVILIAGRDLNDPNFNKTVILITDFNESGTAGLVLNRRTKIPLAEVLPEIGELNKFLEYLYIGGPVATNSIRLLVQSDPIPDGVKHVFDNVYLIETTELFNQLILGDRNNQSMKLYAGYAGWAPGQLESELIRGDWYIWHASAEIIFDKIPEEIWDELIQLVTAKWVRK